MDPTPLPPPRGILQGVAVPKPVHNHSAPSGLSSGPIISTHVRWVTELRKQRGRWSSEVQGPWTETEDAYLDYAYDLFRGGQLQGIEVGLPLRFFMSELLGCEVKRVDEKLVGSMRSPECGCPRHPVRYLSNFEQQAVTTKLVGLEKAFLSREKNPLHHRVVFESPVEEIRRRAYPRPQDARAACAHLRPLLPASLAATGRVASPVVGTIQPNGRTTNGGASTTESKGAHTSQSALLPAVASTAATAVAAAGAAAAAAVGVAASAAAVGVAASAAAGVAASAEAGVAASAAAGVAASAEAGVAASAAAGVAASAPLATAAPAPSTAAAAVVGEVPTGRRPPNTPGTSELLSGAQEGGPANAAPVPTGLLAAALAGPGPVPAASAPFGSSTGRELGQKLLGVARKMEDSSGIEEPLRQRQKVDLPLLSSHRCSPSSYSAAAAAAVALAGENGRRDVASWMDVASREGVVKESPEDLAAMEYLKWELHGKFMAFPGEHYHDLLANLASEIYHNRYPVEHGIDILHGVMRDAGPAALKHSAAATRLSCLVYLRILSIVQQRQVRRKGSCRDVPKCSRG